MTHRVVRQSLVISETIILCCLIKDMLLSEQAYKGEASHQKFIAKYDLPFPLMADTDKSVHEAYGTLGNKKDVWQRILRGRSERLL